MNKATRIIIGVFVLVLVIAGIQYSKSRHNQGISISEKQSIKVGVATPPTGVRADAGEFTKNGLTLAGETINSDPLRKYRLEFVYEDTKYEAPAAVTAVKKFIDIDKLNYIIGPYGTGEVMAVAPTSEAVKKILLVPGAQADDISSAGIYIFRLIHHTEQEAPMFGKFVAEHMKSDILHIIALNTGVTPSYMKNFPPVLEQYGKKIGLVEKFEGTATEFKTQLLKIKETNPTDISIIATPKQTGLILKQADEIGLRAQFYGIGAEDPELVQIAGPLADGLFYPYSYDATSSEYQVQRFHDAYLKRFGKENDTVAVNAYDAALLLSNCLERVDDNVEAVRQCLYEIKDYAGASGTFSINEEGDAVKQLIIKTIKDGKLVKYQD